MINKKMWINMGVENIEETSKFFNSIGFKEMSSHANNPSMRGFTVADNDTAIMMFDKNMMRGFLGLNADHSEAHIINMSNEVLINIGCDSKEEVDKLYEKVKSAGGKAYTDIGWTDGWMYAFGFADPSGHKWSPMYMDMSKYQK